MKNFQSKQCITVNWFKKAIILVNFFENSDLLKWNFKIYKFLF